MASKRLRKTLPLYSNKDLQAVVELYRKGELRYVSLEQQGKALEEIIEACKGGYYEECLSPKGEILTVFKHDYPTAKSALKDLRDVINATIDTLEEEQQSDIQVVLNVNTHKPLVETNE